MTYPFNILTPGHKKNGRSGRSAALSDLFAVHVFLVYVAVVQFFLSRLAHVGYLYIEVQSLPG